MSTHAAAKVEKAKTDTLNLLGSADGMLLKIAMECPDDKVKKELGETRKMVEHAAK